MEKYLESQHENNKTETRYITNDAILENDWEDFKERAGEKEQIVSEMYDRIIDFVSQNDFSYFQKTKKGDDYTVEKISVTYDSEAKSLLCTNEQGESVDTSPTINRNSIVAICSKFLEQDNSCLNQEDKIAAVEKLKLSYVEYSLRKILELERSGKFTDSATLKAFSLLAHPSGEDETGFDLKNFLTKETTDNKEIKTFTSQTEKTEFIANKISEQFGAINTITEFIFKENKSSLSPRDFIQNITEMNEFQLLSNDQKVNIKKSALHFLQDQKRIQEFFEKNTELTDTEKAAKLCLGEVEPLDSDVSMINKGMYVEICAKDQKIFNKLAEFPEDSQCLGGAARSTSASGKIPYVVISDLEENKKNPYNSDFLNMVKAHEGQHIINQYVMKDRLIIKDELIADLAAKRSKAATIEHVSTYFEEGRFKPNKKQQKAYLRYIDKIYSKPVVDIGILATFPVKHWDFILDHVMDRVIDKNLGSQLVSLEDSNNSIEENWYLNNLS